MHFHGTYYAHYYVLVEQNVVIMHYCCTQFSLPGASSVSSAPRNPVDPSEQRKRYIQCTLCVSCLEILHLHQIHAMLFWYPSAVCLIVFQIQM